MLKSFILQAVLFSCLNLYNQPLIFAQDKPSPQDKIIGTSFKILANGFVKAVDIEKVKYDNIAKLKKMDEDKFKRRYAKVYADLGGLPQEFLISYGLKEQMTKEACIRIIASLDKQAMHKIINAVPDEFIASCFREYLRSKKQDIQNSTIARQISVFWNKLTAKIEAK